MNNFIILTPTFNDWKSLSKVLLEIEKNIKGLKGKFRTLIVDDASNIKPRLHLKNIKRLRKINIITLKKNMGSQKSICIGLQYLKKTKAKAIITIIDSDGNITSSQGIEITSTITTHELVSVDEFKLDPIQESIYSFATLIGCFTLLLILPMIAYFSAVYKEKRDEEARLGTPEWKESQDE